ncbi:MAG: hypothetical protein GY830_06995 [Bacteroidetes bacterium]|nr:hypothetical protein [Bacteroidota bacterium]
MYSLLAIAIVLIFVCCIAIYYSFYKNRHFIIEEVNEKPSNKKVKHKYKSINQENKEEEEAKDDEGILTISKKSTLEMIDTNYEISTSPIDSLINLE